MPRVPVRRPAPAVPPEAVEMLRAFVAHYERLAANCPAPKPGEDAQMDDIRAKLANGRAIWWSDLALAETCVAARSSLDDVRAALAANRRKMHEVMGDGRYAQYLQTAADLTASAPNEAAIRADLADCINTTYYFYGAYGVAARSRSEVTKATMRVAAVVVLFLIAAALILSWHVRPGQSVFGMSSALVSSLEYMIATAIAATVGSVISVQRRLQDPKVEVDPFYREIQTSADRFGVAFVSPFFGATFGILMYGILSSKLVSSTLITFEGGNPAKPGDVAALIVLGFLAGFAEQLVPDVLTRIAANTFGAKDDAATKAPASDKGTADASREGKS